MFYCISDLHGELDKFQRMLDVIQFSASDHLYIIGDVIDRGPLGVDILQRIMDAPNMTMLLGNHEQMCLDTLGPRNQFGARDLWRQNGGAPTYRELLYHRSAPEKNRILRFPTQRYVDLAPFYQAADLAVFPKQCSLSFYDVQACGLPVLSEDNNINKDRNAHGNGLCFAAGDAEDLRSKIQTFLDMPAQTYRQMAQCACQFIADAYDYEDKAREYEQILQDACAAYKAAQTAR